MHRHAWWGVEGWHRHVHTYTLPRVAFFPPIHKLANVALCDRSSVQQQQQHNAVTRRKNVRTCAIRPTVTWRNASALLQTPPNRLLILPNVRRGGRARERVYGGTPPFRWFRLSPARALCSPSSSFATPARTPSIDLSLFLFSWRVSSSSAPPPTVVLCCPSRERASASALENSNSIRYELTIAASPHARTLHRRMVMSLSRERGRKDWRRG